MRCPLRPTLLPSSRSISPTLPYSKFTLINYPQVQLRPQFVAAEVDVEVFYFVGVAFNDPSFSGLAVGVFEFMGVQIEEVIDVGIDECVIEDAAFGI